MESSSVWEREVGVARKRDGAEERQGRNTEELKESKRGTWDDDLKSLRSARFRFKMDCERMEMLGPGSEVAEQRRSGMPFLAIKLPARRLVKLQDSRNATLVRSRRMASAHQPVPDLHG